MAGILPLSQQPYISVPGAEAWGEDLTRRIGILRDVHVEKINEIITHLSSSGADQTEILQEILACLDELKTGQGRLSQEISAGGTPTAPPGPTDPTDPIDPTDPMDPIDLGGDADDDPSFVSPTYSVMTDPVVGVQNDFGSTLAGRRLKATSIAIPATGAFFHISILGYVISTVSRELLERKTAVVEDGTAVVNADNSVPCYLSLRYGGTPLRLLRTAYIARGADGNFMLAGNEVFSVDSLKIWGNVESPTLLGELDSIDAVFRPADTKILLPTSTGILGGVLYFAANDSTMFPRSASFYVHREQVTTFAPTTYMNDEYESRWGRYFTPRVDARNPARSTGTFSYGVSAGAPNTFGASLTVKNLRVWQGHGQLPGWPLAATTDSWNTNRISGSHLADYFILTTMDVPTAGDIIHFGPSASIERASLEAKTPILTSSLMNTADTQGAQFSTTPVSYANSIALNGTRDATVYAARSEDGHIMLAYSANALSSFYSVSIATRTIASLTA